MKHNTRIAPSPSGPVHLGTIRTAYFNWLAARASDGKFIVRIDDTDKERTSQKWAEQFLRTLEWLELDWDDKLYQSERFDIYQACADSLAHMGFAKRKDNHVKLNLNTVPNITYWVDEIAGKMEIQPSNIVGFETMTLIKSDGTPTYHFASCVDDIDMEINHVIRGVDHVTNTSKHVLLYNILGAPLPKYSHVGLLKDKQGKLSKRDALFDFQTYIKQEYDPDAILNFLAKMGWGPSVDNKSTKLLSRSKMIELFLNGGKMKNRDAQIDLDILKSYDRKYKARKAKGRMFNV